MVISKSIALKMPALKDKLRSAGFNKKPEDYVKECLTNALMLSGILALMSLMLFIKIANNALYAVPFFAVAFLMLFFLLLRRVDIAMMKRAKEIDRDVLFAGRFLLVKLNSGKPLINSIVDASNSYGIASKYFREIVRDIELGTPMEDALFNAYKFTPSKRFKKILFQINNALKIGVDVSVPLEATLEEITNEQLVEIQRYGKKLNSLTMFYMLLAIVVPSLGITLFSVVASLVSVVIDLNALLVVLFFLAVVQLIFISIFRSMRPNLNL